jgi:putative OPT family oligopeptide transporter
VKPIAVGGMLVGSAYTLYTMKDSLKAGMSKAFADLRPSKGPQPEVSRTERYMSFRTVFLLIGVMFIFMCALYVHISHLLWPALLAAVVMLLVGFFFATVSGSLCGVIGSSNNPVSGITISTLLIAGLLMVALGVSGPSGVATVLGVAAVACVSSSVAGELLQDFKAGYILGGTPSRIQWAELIAVVVASFMMYFPLRALQIGFGFGSKELPAPQAGLMATLAGGIVGHNVAWPLVIVGMFMGVAMIMMGVRSPMLAALGAYLPFETTCAIFVGGVFRAIGDWLGRRRGYNEGQRARVENAGILTASGFIAGEALMGLLWAGLRAWRWAPPKTPPQIFANPTYLLGTAFLAILAVLLIFVPMTSAGDPNEPPPPAAMM